MALYERTFSALPHHNAVTKSGDATLSKFTHALSEFIDNSIEATGKASAGKEATPGNERRIDINVLSHSLNSGKNERPPSFLTIADNGCGMSFEDISNFCKFALDKSTRKETIVASNTSSIGKFGVGAKQSGFWLGDRIRIITKTKAQVILPGQDEQINWTKECTMDSVAMDSRYKAATAAAGPDGRLAEVGVYDQTVLFRDPSSSCRWDGAPDDEKASDRLMSLLEDHEKKNSEHFTFIIIRLKPHKASEFFKDTLTTRKTYGQYPSELAQTYHFHLHPEHTPARIHELSKFNLSNNEGSNCGRKAAMYPSALPALRGLAKGPGKPNLPPLNIVFSIFEFTASRNWCGIPGFTDVILRDVDSAVSQHIEAAAACFRFTFDIPKPESDRDHSNAAPRNLAILGRASALEMATVQGMIFYFPFQDGKETRPLPTLEGHWGGRAKKTHLSKTATGGKVLDIDPVRSGLLDVTASDCEDGAVATERLLREAADPLPISHQGKLGSSVKPMRGAADEDGDDEDEDLGEGVAGGGPAKAMGVDGDEIIDEDFGSDTDSSPQHLREIMSRPEQNIFDIYWSERLLPNSHANTIHKVFPSQATTLADCEKLGLSDKWRDRLKGYLFFDNQWHSVTNNKLALRIPSGDLDSYLSPKSVQNEISVYPGKYSMRDWLQECHLNLDREFLCSERMRELESKLAGSSGAGVACFRRVLWGGESGIELCSGESVKINITQSNYVRKHPNQRAERVVFGRIVCFSVKGQCQQAQEQYHGAPEVHYIRLPIDVYHGNESDFYTENNSADASERYKFEKHAFDANFPCSIQSIFHPGLNFAEEKNKSSIKASSKDITDVKSRALHAIELYMFKEKNSQAIPVLKDSIDLEANQLEYYKFGVQLLNKKMKPICCRPPPYIKTKYTEPGYHVRSYLTDHEPNVETGLWRYNSSTKEEEFLKATTTATMLNDAFYSTFGPNRKKIKLSRSCVFTIQVLESGQGGEKRILMTKKINFNIVTAHVTSWRLLLLEDEVNRNMSMNSFLPRFRIELLDKNQEIATNANCKIYVEIVGECMSELRNNKVSFPARCYGLNDDNLITAYDLVCGYSIDDGDAGVLRMGYVATGGIVQKDSGGREYTISKNEDGGLWLPDFPRDGSFSNDADFQSKGKDVKFSVSVFILDDPADDDFNHSKRLGDSQSFKVLCRSTLKVAEVRRVIRPGEANELIITEGEAIPDLTFQCFDRFGHPVHPFSTINPWVFTLESNCKIDGDLEVTSSATGEVTFRGLRIAAEEQEPESAAGLKANLVVKLKTAGKMQKPWTGAPDIDPVRSGLLDVTASDCEDGAAATERLLRETADPFPVSHQGKPVWQNDSFGSSVKPMRGAADEDGDDDDEDVGEGEGVAGGYGPGFNQENYECIWEPKISLLDELVNVQDIGSKVKAAHAKFDSFAEACQPPQIIVPLTIIPDSQPSIIKLFCNGVEVVDKIHSTSGSTVEHLTLRVYDRKGKQVAFDPCWFGEDKKKKKKKHILVSWNENFTALRPSANLTDVEIPLPNIPPLGNSGKRDLSITLLTSSDEISVEFSIVLQRGRPTDWKLLITVDCRKDGVRADDPKDFASKFLRIVMVDENDFQVPHGGGDNEPTPIILVYNVDPVLAASDCEDGAAATERLLREAADPLPVSHQGKRELESKLAGSSGAGDVSASDCEDRAAATERLLRETADPLPIFHQGKPVWQNDTSLDDDDDSSRRNKKKARITAQSESSSKGYSARMEVGDFGETPAAKRGRFGSSIKPIDESLTVEHCAGEEGCFCFLPNTALAFPDKQGVRNKADECFVWVVVKDSQSQLGDYVEKVKLTHGLPHSFQLKCDHMMITDWATADKISGQILAGYKGVGCLTVQLLDKNGFPAVTTLGKKLKIEVKMTCLAKTFGNFKKNAMQPVMFENHFPIKSVLDALTREASMDIDDASGASDAEVSLFVTCSYKYGDRSISLDTKEIVCRQVRLNNVVELRIVAVNHNNAKSGECAVQVDTGLGDLHVFPLTSDGLPLSVEDLTRWVDMWDLPTLHFSDKAHGPGAKRRQLDYKDLFSSHMVDEERRCLVFTAHEQDRRSADSIWKVGFYSLQVKYEEMRNFEGGFSFDPVIAGFDFQITAGQPIKLFPDPISAAKFKSGAAASNIGSRADRMIVSGYKISGRDDFDNTAPLPAGTVVSCHLRRARSIRAEGKVAFGEDGAAATERLLRETADPLPISHQGKPLWQNDAIVSLGVLPQDAADAVFVSQHIRRALSAESEEEHSPPASDAARSGETLRALVGADGDGRLRRIVRQGESFAMFDLELESGVGSSDCSVDVVFEHDQKAAARVLGGFVMRFAFTSNQTTIKESKELKRDQQELEAKIHEYEERRRMQMDYFELANDNITVLFEQAKTDGLQRLSRDDNQHLKAALEHELDEIQNNVATQEQSFYRKVKICEEKSASMLALRQVADQHRIPYLGNVVDLAYVDDEEEAYLMSWVACAAMHLLVTTGDRQETYDMVKSSNNRVDVWPLIDVPRFEYKNAQGKYSKRSDEHRSNRMLPVKQLAPHDGVGNIPGNPRPLVNILNLPDEFEDLRETIFFSLFGNMVLFDDLESMLDWKEKTKARPQQKVPTLLSVKGGYLVRSDGRVECMPAKQHVELVFGSTPPNKNIALRNLKHDKDLCASLIREATSRDQSEQSLSILEDQKATYEEWRANLVEVEERLAEIVGLARTS